MACGSRHEYYLIIVPGSPDEHSSPHSNLQRLILLDTSYIFCVSDLTMDKSLAVQTTARDRLSLSGRDGGGREGGKAREGGGRKRERLKC